MGGNRKEMKTRETCFLEYPEKRDKKTIIRIRTQNILWYEMNKVLLLLCVLLFFPLVHSLEIVSYEATVELTNMTPKESIVFTLLNTDVVEIDELNYPFSGDVEDITVIDSLGTLSSTLDFRGKNAFVTAILRRPLRKDESVTLIYDIETHGLLTKRGDTHILSQSHSLLANVKKFKLNIILPEGYGITEEGVSPTPTRFISDGRRIILVWEYGTPIPTELREFRVILLFEKLIQEEPTIIVETVEPPPVSNSNPMVLPYMVIAVLFLVLIPLGLHYLRAEDTIITALFRKKRGIENKIDILREDEQSILKLVVEEDGIDQRDIQRITDFSKTKVSKILSELEKRGAITKQQIGRRNKIYLTDKIKEAK